MERSSFYTSMKMHSPGHSSADSITPSSLPAPTLATSIDVTVSGPLARTVVTQRFRNVADEESRASLKTLVARQPVDNMSHDERIELGRHRAAPRLSLS